MNLGKLSGLVKLSGSNPLVREAEDVVALGAASFSLAALKAYKGAEQAKLFGLDYDTWALIGGKVLAAGGGLLGKGSSLPVRAASRVGDAGAAAIASKLGEDFGFKMKAKADARAAALPGRTRAHGLPPAQAGRHLDPSVARALSRL